MYCKMGSLPPVVDALSRMALAHFYIISFLFPQVERSLATTTNSRSKRHDAIARVNPMIEILMAAMITRLDAKTPPAMPQQTAMDQVWLAILLVGLLAVLILAVAW
jgi:hypothetical protein